jgi:hypothetical protein
LSLERFYGYDKKRQPDGRVSGAVRARSRPCSPTSSRVPIVAANSRWPNRRGAVALPTDAPAETQEPAAPSVHSPAVERLLADVADPGASALALDFLEQPSAHPSTRQPSPPKQPSPPANVRRLSRQEKDRRRARRNLVLMAVGIVVLTIAAVVLSRV